jgi:branched-chain amino acid transport system substrate-binding protein
MAIMELAPKYGKPIMSVEPVSEEIAKKIASNPKRYWNFWKGDWGSSGYADSVFSTYRFMESKGFFKSKTNKIAFIVEDTDYGRSNAETAKALFAGAGIQSVAMETVPLGYTDFYPQLGKLKNLGPDLLMTVFLALYFQRQVKSLYSDSLDLHAARKAAWLASRSRAFCSRCWL